jgi:hypothetical protein
VRDVRMEAMASLATAQTSCDDTCRDQRGVVLGDGDGHERDGGVRSSSRRRGSPSRPAMTAQACARGATGRRSRASGRGEKRRSGGVWCRGERRSEGEARSRAWRRAERGGAAGSSGRRATKTCSGAGAGRGTSGAGSGASEAERGGRT